MGYLTLGLLLVGCVQAYMYWRQSVLMAEQAKLTKQASDTSKESAERQVRAYLSIIKIEAIRHSSNNAPPLRDWRKWEITLKNVGQTPAVRLRIENGCDILDHRINKLSELTKWDKEIGSVTDISPQQTVTTHATLPQEIPDDWVEACEAEDGPFLYVYGRLIYEDVFGWKITTNFCQCIRGRQFMHEKCGNETTYEKT
jgi:hypothetical protein